MYKLAGEPKIIGPCSKEFVWMEKEGFFDDKSRISENWLFNASEESLFIFMNLIEGSSDRDVPLSSYEENKLDDAFYTIMCLESLKNEKNDFEFSDEKANDWITLYGICSILELQRRKGLVYLEDKNVPMADMLWGLTEEGHEEVNKIKGDM